MGINVNKSDIPSQEGSNLDIQSRKSDARIQINTESGRRDFHSPESAGQVTVLVTGATGFLGEYLIRQLAGQYRVLALGRNREKGKLLEKWGAVFCPGDFTDRESCSKYFSGVRYVIHAGALSTVWGRWEDFYHTNVLGTALVAELCRENNVQRMVYVSSPSIYTEKKDRYDIEENQAPAKNNLNYYIKSKLMAEKVVEKWHQKGLETVILRPRGLIGIGDTSLVPRLLRANQGIGIPLFRQGKNLVDLTSVENAALACRLAMTAPQANGLTFNITNGEPKEFKSLLEKFLTVSGQSPHYRKLPFSMVYGVAAGLEWIYKNLHLRGEPPLTRYTACTLGFSQTMNISRAKELLGYKPEKTLDQAIEEYGKWWKKENGQPSRNLSIWNGKGPDRITRVVQYHCGSCTNDLSVIFSKTKKEKRKFPATATLIQHREVGNILYDTGYSEQIFQKRFALGLYRRFNPVSLKPEERIHKRLFQDKISPESVNMIILSHAHPDHVGGLTYFSRYNPELMASKDTRTAMEASGFFRLAWHCIRKGAPIPRFVRLTRPLASFANISWRTLEEFSGDHFLYNYFDKVYDLLGDGSIMGVELNGHCKGQLGLWIPDKRLFLAADACWGRDLIGRTRQMRLIPRWIQENFSEYNRTIDGICRLKRDYPDIHVEFSHQAGTEKIYG